MNSLFTCRLLTRGLVTHARTLAVAQAKRVTQEGQDADICLAHTLEQEAFGMISASEDRNKGIDAFLAKRDPKFRGR